MFKVMLFNVNASWNVFSFDILECYFTAITGIHYILLELIKNREYVFFNCNKNLNISVIFIFSLTFEHLLYL